MNETWYCSTACATEAIAEQIGRPEAPATTARPQALPPLKLGMLLVHHGALTPAALRTALDGQRISGRRLGEELLATGVVDDAAIVKALAVQAGVPFIATLDPAAIKAYPDLLGAATVRALGMVPFGIDVERRRLKVATTAPVARLALAALSELTGWTAEPFLVPDRAMPRLIAAYEQASSSHPVSSLTVSSLDDAPAQVASEAARTPDARVQHVVCDRYVWVRIQGRGPASDVFVMPEKETPSWLAAPTSH
jgi:MshEN domain